MTNQPLDRYRGFNFRLRTQAPEHLPSRPTWLCGVCGEPWPCSTSRAALLAEGTPTRLAALMWIYLETYAQDAGPGPLDGAFDRFLRWTR